MAFESAKRFATMGVMAEELQRWLQKQSGAATAERMFRSSRFALPPLALQLIELLLERLEPLARFAQPSFRGQPLVLGEVACGFGDEGVDVSRRRRGRCRRCRGSLRLRRLWRSGR